MRGLGFSLGFAIAQSAGPIPIASAVTNFAPGSWTAGAGWTANGDGTATYTAGSGTSDLTATGVLEENATYEVSFTVSGLSEGNINLRFGDLGVIDVTASANGTYTQTIVATGGVGIRFRAANVTTTDVTLSDFTVVKTADGVAPVFVGSATNATANGASTITVDMSAISIQAGDLILVSAAGTATSDYAGGVNTAGYTEIAELAVASGTWRVNQHVAFKIADGTETSVELVGSNYGTQGGNSAQVRVYRGVSNLDVAAVTKAVAGNTRPDPDAITPSTPGAAIVVLAAGGRSGVMDTAYTLTGLSNGAQQGAGTQGVRLGGGDVSWTGGAYNPGAWTGGNADPGGSYCAVTLALA